MLTIFNHVIKTKIISLQVEMKLIIFFLNIKFFLMHIYAEDLN